MATAKTSQHLADTLRAAGFLELAQRAEADEFHDFLSPHAMPDMLLDRELYALASDPSLTDQLRIAASMIRSRHHNGEFDASAEESDEWAQSEDGLATFDALVESLGRKEGK